VAHLLQAKGIQAYVIEGGLRGWKKAGLPLEPIPEEETIALPSFRSPAPPKPSPDAGP
jgi:3-mercaptopyruvate sulfurtransferase SseA